MRRRYVLLAVAVLGLASLVVALPALALNIPGTNGNDTLRGTARIDRIDGRGGNDRLYGLAGNDVLVGGAGRDFLAGGPGNDRLVTRDDVLDTVDCGAGRDRVVADDLDVARSNCEIVVGPPVPPTPPTPPAPEPPPPVAVAPGSYKGQTQTANFVFFDVLSERAVKGWRVNDLRLACDDGYHYIYGSIDTGAYATPIDGAGSFRMQLDYSTTITWDAGGTTPAMVHDEIAGLIRDSSASGTAQSRFEFDLDGRHRRCSASETWTANRLP